MGDPNTREVATPAPPIWGTPSGVSFGCGCQNPVRLVNIKVGGIWVVIRPQNRGIGYDPWPFEFVEQVFPWWIEFELLGLPGKMGDGPGSEVWCAVCCFSVLLMFGERFLR